VKGLARQAATELERQRLAASGEDTGHLGRTNPSAPEELDLVSQRCTVIAGQVTAAVLPDWSTPARIGPPVVTIRPLALVSRQGGR